MGFHGHMPIMPVLLIDTGVPNVVMTAMLIAEAYPAISQLSEIILNDEESGRVGQARSFAVRHCRSGSHLLLRATLSRQLDADPRDFCFTRTVSGKPLLAGLHTGRAHFSIARTRDIVAVATSTEGPVGVDVESMARYRNATLDPSDWLSPLERDSEKYLEDATHDGQRLRRWTLKEAYSKAIGTGFTTPPDEIGFEMSGVEPTARLAVPSEAACWRFLTFDLPSQSMASIALNTERLFE